MNMKRLLCFAMALCLMLCLCACGNADNNEEAPQSGNEAPAPSDNAADDVPQASDDATKDTSEEAPAGVVYNVTVTDEGGNPVVGAMVQLCQGEMCLLPSATDADGIVSFTVAEEAPYEAKLLALPEGYEYATEEQVFPFNGAFELTITLKAVA